MAIVVGDQEIYEYVQLHDALKEELKEIAIIPDKDERKLSLYFFKAKVKQQLILVSTPEVPLAAAALHSNPIPEEKKDRLKQRIMVVMWVAMLSVPAMVVIHFTLSMLQQRFTIAQIQVYKGLHETSMVLIPPDTIIARETHVEHLRNGFLFNPGIVCYKVHGVKAVQVLGSIFFSDNGSWFESWTYAPNALELYTVSSEVIGLDEDAMVDTEIGNRYTSQIILYDDSISYADHIYTKTAESEEHQRILTSLKSAQHGF